MTITKVEYPRAPSTTPQNSTLLDVADVTEGVEWLDGTDPWYDSYNCMRFDASAEFCAPNEKDFSGSAGWELPFRFVAVGGATCQSIGLDQGRMKSEVQKVFEHNESVAVERGFLATRFIESTVDNPGGDPYWEAPTNITPAGGAVKPVVGLALLEAYARDHYAGVPTLHVPVVIGSLLLAPSFLELDGKVARTRLGSPVAIGGGYDYPNTGPDGSAAATGEKWIYATGAVSVRRGDLEVIQALEQSNNEVSVMAERIYMGAVDCFSAAVKVQVTS